MDDVYNNIDNYNPKRENKNFTCVWWHDSDIMTNKKFQVIIKELFITCEKL